MRTTLFLLFLVLMLSRTGLPGQNNALHFDGNGDYVTLIPISGWAANTDFTVEAWFTALPDGLPCNFNFRRLFAVSVPGRFEIGQCGGVLYIYWTDPTGHGPFAIPTPGINILDGNWHCIGVVRSGPVVEIYLDGIQVYSVSTVGTLSSSLFRVGHWSGGATQDQDWLGAVDEVRLWNVALPASQLMTCGHCLLTGAEPGLVAYWQFDQGIPAGNNTGITQVLDASFAGNNPGILHPFSATPDPGFDLMGPDGNFIASGAPLVYPNYNNLSVFISDPIQMVGIPWICNGAAVHFSLIDYNGNVPQAGSGVTVAWEYSDNQGPWTSIPSLNGFQFGVSPNGATAINCPTPTGYVDREYRAIITVTNANGTCVFVSQPALLRIYCEITSLNVQAVSAPPAPLCEGDQATFSVSVSTNLPPPGPTNDVHIDWCVSDDGGGSWTVLGQFYDQLSFTYPPTPLTVGAKDICFKAVVSNGACGSLTGQTCIHVDPNPMCGGITGLAVPPNLTLVGTTPWLTYEICPGNDASVGMDPVLPPFKNCNPQWQYTFTPNNPASWVDLGFTNSVQNTNILPTGSWGSNTSIFYRIQCKPLSTPSGCDPCLSNIIEIRLKPPTPVPSVVAVPSTQTICYGDMVTLYSSNDPGTQTTWYCNGEVIGTGPFIPVSSQACYWSEATDGCTTERSDTICLTVCTATAIITCPEDNPCIIPNIPITLSGLLSWSTCGPIVQYDWEVEFLPDPPGPIYFFSGPTVTFTPPPGGAIVTLTVIDANGCSHSFQSYFKPCQP